MEILCVFIFANGDFGGKWERLTEASIHSYVNGNEKQEILFLEIWTNGSLTPKEALYEASRNLIDLFLPFLHAEEDNFHLEKNQDKVTLPLFTFHELEFRQGFGKAEPRLRKRQRQG